jgi:hypothetical protein
MYCAISVTGHWLLMQHSKIKNLFELFIFMTQSTGILTSSTNCIFVADPFRSFDCLCLTVNFYSPKPSKYSSATYVHCLRFVFSLLCFTVQLCFHILCSSCLQLTFLLLKATLMKEVNGVEFVINGFERWSRDVTYRKYLRIYIRTVIA